ncbi:MAG: hypothetical protein IJJ26_00495 [Victivallales bacterium]|nr:hypothetical protein [Victivallales bacterium]
MRRSVLAIFLLCALPLLAQRWHHGPSRYRASFTWKGEPGASGVLLKIPVQGIGKDGTDVFCFDDKGHQLLSRRLGECYPDSTLIQVIPQDGKRIFAYFGSALRAPQAKIDLTPPIASIYALPKKLDGKSKWADIVKALPHAELLGRLPMKSIVEVCNPVDACERFIVSIEATMHVKKTQTRHLFLACDDAGYFFLDGGLVISRDGINGVYGSSRGENRREFRLEQGMHSIRLVGVNYESLFAIALGEWFPEPRVAFVPPGDFVQCIDGTLQRLEGNNGAAVPFFKFTHTGYMQMENMQLTQTFLETYSGDEAVWTFGDGVRLKGAKISRVFGTLEAVPVKCDVRGVAATGKITFPQKAPRMLHVNNQGDWQRMADQLEAVAPQVRDSVELAGFLAFYDLQPLDERVLPVAERLLKQEDLSDEQRVEAMTAIARAAAAHKPEKSLAAYNFLLKQPNKPWALAKLLEEALDFAIFRLRDLKTAERFLAECAPRLPRDGKALAAARMDIALQAGQLEEARKHFNKLLEYQAKSQETRIATVRGTSIRARVEDLLKQNRILDAERFMRQWIADSPQDRGNGSYSLARALCFQKRGWLDGAIGELTSAIQADPLLPNLPDVEFQLANLYQAKGDSARAQELWRKFAKEYPNHPLAEKAASHVK